MIKIILKQLMCKHKNKECRWDYPKQWIYNEFFDQAQTTRYKESFCKDCGKSLGIIWGEVVFANLIYEEVKRKYLEDKQLNNNKHD